MGRVHRRTVRSAPDEASVSPSGLQVTARTPGRRGRRGGQPGWPLAPSHSRIARSSPAEARIWPFELQATAFTVPPLRSRGSRGSTRLPAARHVPEPDHVVGAGRGQRPRARAPGHRQHPVGVPSRGPPWASPPGRVLTGAPSCRHPRGQHLAVRAERDPAHCARRARRGSAGALALACVPQAHRPVPPGRGQRPPSGLQATASTAPGVAVQERRSGEGLYSRPLSKLLRASTVWPSVVGLARSAAGPGRAAVA